MTQVKPGSKSPAVTKAGSKSSATAKDAPPEEPLSGPKSKTMNPDAPPVNTSGDGTPFSGPKTQT